MEDIILSFTNRIYKITGRNRRRLDHKLTSITDEILKRELEIRNPIIKNKLTAATIKFRLNYRKFLRNRELNVQQYYGTSKINGKNLNTIFIGDEFSSQYILQTIYDTEKVKKNTLEKIFSSKKSKILDLRNQDVDLVIIEKLLNDKWLPNSGESVQAPRWVRMVYQRKDDDLQNLKRKIKKNNWRNFTNIVRSGFFPIICNQKDDVELFYHSMYLPLVKKRFPNNGTIFSLDFLQNQMNNGFLMFSCLPDGKKVAGSIFIVCGKTLYGLVSGVLDADEELYKKGALSSLYLFGFEYAFENGYESIDVGQSLPLKIDGIYLHKKSWGFEPEICPWLFTDWIFWVPNNSENAFDWIKSIQFLPHFITIKGDFINSFYSEGNYLI